MSIEIEQVKFSGSPGFNKDGQEYVPEEVDQPRYVGEPGPDIDKSWERLIEGTFMTHSLLIVLTLVLGFSQQLQK